MVSKTILRIAYFSDNGKTLTEKLKDQCQDYILEVWHNNLFSSAETSEEKHTSLTDWTRDSFEHHLPILFIGAVGIAVRTIAPFVDNKLSDSPVVVMDELGQNVISLLSGHFGGANDLARRLAKITGANAVITTATDVNNAFAIDVFAKNNGFRILDKSRIKAVSSKVLKGIQVKYSISLDNYEEIGSSPANFIQSDDNPDIIITDDYENIASEGCPLVLIPKRMVFGMGCKKGKNFDELLEFVNTYYENAQIMGNLHSICSIDVKANEIGLIKLAQYFGVPFETFSAQQLQGIPYDFDESEFVKTKVGVGNVCERAAVMMATKSDQNRITEFDNENIKLSVLKRQKTAFNGITLAESRIDKIFINW
ncbi:MAG: cobalamin biosynthesis protein [Pseudobutyrivibrio sp.]|nr:cobalamin biosynthesis protein [Pseudobutyrivibrio sp.]